jgi:hypothetical protein
MKPGQIEWLPLQLPQVVEAAAELGKEVCVEAYTLPVKALCCFVETGMRGPEGQNPILRDPAKGVRRDGRAIGAGPCKDGFPVIEVEYESQRPASDLH